MVKTDASVSWFCWMLPWTGSLLSCKLKDGARPFSLTQEQQKACVSLWRIAQISLPRDTQQVSGEPRQNFGLNIRTASQNIKFAFPVPGASGHGSTLGYRLKSRLEFTQIILRETAKTYDFYRQVLNEHFLL